MSIDVTDAVKQKKKAQLAFTRFFFASIKKGFNILQLSSN